MPVKHHHPTLNRINCATLRYGGILTSIWIWSGYACASMLSTFLHNFIYALHSLYITLLLYFGAKYDIGVYIWNVQYFLFDFSCTKVGARMEIVQVKMKNSK